VIEKATIARGIRRCGLLEAGKEAQGSKGMSERLAAIHPAIEHGYRVTAECKADRSYAARAVRLAGIAHQTIRGVDVRRKVPERIVLYLLKHGGG
jgi:hypothetical protein